MLYLVMAASALLAGVVQSVTGFGAGVMMMQFLPYALPMTVAPAVSQFVCLPLTYSLSWRYRAHICYRQVILPIVCYITFSTVAIWMAKRIDLDRLTLFFGIFLILLSLYFMFFSKKLKVSGNIWTALLCASLSGLLSGLFGIGGPTLVMYYIAATKTKEEYLGTINFVFAVSITYQVIVRFATGALTLNLLPLLAIGTAGILAGRIIGTKIVDKIDGEKLKKIVYVFLAISGVITTINAL